MRVYFRAGPVGVSTDASGFAVLLAWMVRLLPFCVPIAIIGVVTSDQPGAWIMGLLFLAMAITVIGVRKLFQRFG